KRQELKGFLDELDLLREAANASQLRRNFRDDPRLVVPAVDWNLTTTSVMVTERVHGIRIDDTESLRAAGVALHEVAMLGVDLFFTQVFRDSYFHADLHPGNLFVIPPTEEQPLLRIAAVDFGIMGSLSDFDQRYLADNFLAFLDRDYRKVAELHVESGWVPAGTRVDEFEDAIRGVCEPILERPLREISFGYLLLRLFQTARRFHMEILPQLLLLQKTLINIEGLGRQLDPDLDLWQAARPSMERWMKERTGLRRLVNKSKENLPFVMERLPELPDLLLDALAAQRGEGERHKELLRRLGELERRLHGDGRRGRQAVAGGALVLAAALLLGLGESITPLLAGLPLSVWLSGTAGLVLLLLSQRD
ncbi:MAG: ubiquinone biosynthesis regulatory protein kinase UbiB, partial [Gammaproteobacteria bacterium]